MVILMILIVAAIIPVTYAPSFGTKGYKIDDGNKEGLVAKWPATMFLTLTFIFSTRNSIPGFLLGISYEN